MADPVSDIIGDYRAFAALQRDRLAARGIDIAPYALSHIAYRVADWDLYLHLRTLLERHATANAENVWNGRPISLIVLSEPLEVLDGTPVSLIELIPPVHQRVYRMGLEHLGVVIGDDVDAFSREHRAALTGQQFQSADHEPYYVLFEDFTHVKFNRRSLYDAAVLQGPHSTLRPRRRLGPAAVRHCDRPGSAAAVTEAIPPSTSQVTGRGRGGT
jgi:predicted metalloenzyme YecM